MFKPIATVSLCLVSASFFFFLCLGKAALHECDLFWVTSLIKLCYFFGYPVADIMYLVLLLCLVDPV